MDYLTIDDLRIQGVHGHYEHERKTEQEFLVTLRVGFDSTAAATTDVLGDTIDYDRLRDIILNEFAGEPQYLIERLAETIAQKILCDTVAQEVTITIQKTAVWPNGVPGISLTRTKS